NPSHDADARSYYLVHGFGSIVQWSTDFERAEKVFNEVRSAKRARRDDPERFERALKTYRQFEERSSNHAVWVIDQVGHRSAIRPYTVFFRADIEAMTIFHRTGHSPRWREFYAQWKRRVKSGEVWVKPFSPMPFARFEPKRIPPQEVLQAA